MQSDKAGLVGRQAAQCRSCQPKGLRAEDPDIRATTGSPDWEPALTRQLVPTLLLPLPQKSPLRAPGSEKVARGASPQLSHLCSWPLVARWLRRKAPDPASAPLSESSGPPPWPALAPTGRAAGKAEALEKRAPHGPHLQAASPKPPAGPGPEPGRFRGPPAPGTQPGLSSPLQASTAAERTRPGCSCRQAGSSLPT